MPIWVRNANDRSSNNGDQSIPESEFKPISEEDGRIIRESYTARAFDNF
jgi:hypothetical protein